MGVPVLIVDDDETLRESLRMLFEDEGYQVFEAPDGKPALERLSEHPDGMVVVLDYNMPGMDGRQLLEAIAQQDALVRRHGLILATAKYARTFPLAFVRLLTQLSVQVIVKPFDIHDLLAAVEQAKERLAPVDVRAEPD